MGWYYENKAYQMKMYSGNEVQAPFQSIQVNILRGLTGKTVRVADANLLIISKLMQRKAEDCWSVLK